MTRRQTRQQIHGTDDEPRFLSEAQCHDLLQRLTRYVTEGTTGVTIRSRWSANVRWARNQISTAGEIREDWITVERTIRGVRQAVTINDVADSAMVAAARRAERLIKLQQEPRDVLEIRTPLEPATTPNLFSDATSQLGAKQRADVAHQLAQASSQGGFLSAGYVEVSATSIAALDTLGRFRYFPYTDAQYSVTVRDAKNGGSGWAGDSCYDWTKLDTTHLSQVALDKCLHSRNPVAIEPGRYTTILEPQAVCDLLSILFSSDFSMAFPRNLGGWSTLGPFFKSLQQGWQPNFTRLGERVADARVTISADPMDPELGFPPFNTQWQAASEFFENGAVYHPATWIDRGVLTSLDYDRKFAVGELGRSTGLPNSGAFRMTGGTTSIDDMIATTKRGIVVTRLDSIFVDEDRSQLCRGYTRNGCWLVENGKISKAIKNMAFTESILFVLNNIEELGVPQRTFHPNTPIPPFLVDRQPQPVIVPALKIRDFSFTALADAI